MIVSFGFYRFYSLGCYNVVSESCRSCWPNH